MDIRSRWMHVVRRLQSLGCKQNGCAIITIKVMVDENGEPLLWTTPEMVQLEPRESTQKFMVEMIMGLTE